MKKVLLILIVISMVCSCSKDSEATEIIDENVIATFKQSNAGSDVTKFFASELPLMRKYYDFEVPFYWRGTIYTETCKLVNSMEEFQAFYFGDVPLPQIDFSNQTLIIGWKEFGTFDEMDKMELRKDEKGYSLNVYTLRHKGLNKVDMCWVSYWGIFPKQAQEPVSVNIIINTK